MMKVVLKLELPDDKIKQKAMKSVSGLPGVYSITIDMKDKIMTVTGDVDPVTVVVKLRKICHTDIVLVGPAKEPEKKMEVGPAKEPEKKMEVGPAKEQEKKDDSTKKDDTKKDNNKKHFNHPPYHYYYQPQQQRQPYYHQQSSSHVVPSHYYGASVVEDDNPNACVIC